MAQPAQAGLLPTETAFLCEMELVTVIPRERFSSLKLLGVRHIHCTFFSGLLESS